jgi:hypothetical protein
MRRFAGNIHPRVKETVRRYMKGRCWTRWFGSLLQALATKAWPSGLLTEHVFLDEGSGGVAHLTATSRQDGGKAINGLERELQGIT